MRNAEVDADDFGGADLASAAPIVKWAGGKSRLLPELVARLPSQFDRYFEPFAGGAALFFHLAPRAAFLSDSNADLIHLYDLVARRVEGVIDWLHRYRSRHGEAFYYETRDRWNRDRMSWGDLERAAAFVYLNKTCFNGLWRVNRSGAFNVPIGRYTNPSIFDPEVLRASSAALARAELACGDYRSAVSGARAGDLIYFDPPYDPAGDTANFTGYTAESFGPDDQAALADLSRVLVGRGCSVVLSNADTPRIRSLYDGFRIDRVSCARAINSKATKRGDVDELIIVGTARGVHA